MSILDQIDFLASAAATISDNIDLVATYDAQPTTDGWRFVSNTRLAETVSTAREGLVATMRSVRAAIRSLDDLSGVAPVHALSFAERDGLHVKEWCEQKGYPALSSWIERTDRGESGGDDNDLEALLALVEEAVIRADVQGGVVTEAHPKL